MAIEPRGDLLGPVAQQLSHNRDQHNQPGPGVHWEFELLESSGRRRRGADCPRVAAPMAGVSLMADPRIIPADQLPAGPTAPASPARQ